MSFRQLIRHRGIMGTASAAVAVVIAGGVVAAVAPGHQQRHESISSAADNQPATGASAAASPSASATPKPVAPLQILSVTPSRGAHDANGAAPIKITFNEVLAATTPLPTLSPKIDGSWTVSGDTATFAPKLGYAQNTHVTVTVPGGSSGVQAAGLSSAGTTTTAATNAGLLPEDRDAVLHHRHLLHATAAAAADPARLPAADLVPDGLHEPRRSRPATRTRSCPPRTTRRPAASPSTLATLRAQQPVGGRARPTCSTTGPSGRSRTTTTSPWTGRPARPCGLTC